MKKINIKSDYLVVLIATHNRIGLLKKSINSVIKGTTVPYEIIVIDGGSTDGTIEYLKKRQKLKNDITPVFQGKIVGTSRCYNLVWRKISCKFTIWLSDDTMVTKGSLDLACKILENHPEIGMVGLKMKDTVGPNVNLPYCGGISRIGIFNCNHAVLPYKFLKSIGFFNEDYMSYTVDPDLTASVLSAGKTAVMTKKTGVLHERKWALKETLSQKAKREGGGIDNAQIYYSKFQYLFVAQTILFVLTKRLLIILVSQFFRNTSPFTKKLWGYKRDWVVIINSRFISLFDIYINRNNPYHLVQKIPKKYLVSKFNPYYNLISKNDG